MGQETERAYQRPRKTSVATGQRLRLTLVCGRRNRPFRPRIARPPNIRNGPCGWQLMPIANVRAGGARGGRGATDAPCVTTLGPSHIRGLSSEVAFALLRLLLLLESDRVLAKRRWRYRRMHRVGARAARCSARRVRLLRAICSPWRHGQTRPRIARVCKSSYRESVHVHATYCFGRGGYRQGDRGA